MLKSTTTVKDSQFIQPLFEFSGACAGCGETPYVKLATQLFGDRMIIANATGCSSIYGGSSPTCPYTTNSKGHGPAWANLLFEDNAEFGFGMHLAYQQRRAKLADAIDKLMAAEILADLKAGFAAWLEDPQDAKITKDAAEQIKAALPAALEAVDGDAAESLKFVANNTELLVKKIYLDLRWRRLGL